MGAWEAIKRQFGSRFCLNAEIFWGHFQQPAANLAVTNLQQIRSLSWANLISTGQTYAWTEAFHLTLYKKTNKSISQNVPQVYTI